ncbi:MAG: helix-turn-helix domain-containing protein [Thermoplasmata archaeon]
MDKLMTLEEVADYLRISKDTLYKMAQEGRIPASKIGVQWRFRKEDIDRWVDGNRPNVKSKGRHKGN